MINTRACSDWRVFALLTQSHTQVRPQLVDFSVSSAARMEFLWYLSPLFSYTNDVLINQISVVMNVTQTYFSTAQHPKNWPFCNGVWRALMFVGFFRENYLLAIAEYIMVISRLPPLCEGKHLKVNELGPNIFLAQEWGNHSIPRTQMISWFSVAWFSLCSACNTGYGMILRTSAELTHTRRNRPNTCKDRNHDD